VFVCGLGLLSSKALAGVFVYVVGHGLNKAALFMCVGVLLHRFATVDEYDLHGRGREVPVVGVLMAIGGLVLATLPPFTSFAGKSLLESASTEAGYGWLIAVFVIASALTGGAVLRVTGRIFLGWGPSEGPDPTQARAAEERVDEERGPREHTPAMMIAVPAVLIAATLLVGLVPGVVPGVERLAARFADHGAYARWVLHDARIPLPHVPASHVELKDVGFSLLAVAGAVAAAVVGLFGRPLRESLPAGIREPSRHVVRGLRHLHSGQIGDYVTWWTAGAAVIGGVCLLALS
jgi:multicomponent Na+:H+ antiporter subunit D